MAKASVRRKLIDAILGSQLPGDEAIGEARLDEIADFLVATAEVRRPGKPELALLSHGDERRFMQLAVINEDMPFLVDSIAGTLAAHGLAINMLLHPIVEVGRDDDGALVSLKGDGRTAATAESFIYIETPRIDARQRRDLQQALTATLDDVRHAVGDWRKMMARMEADAAQVDDGEGEALLRWFASGMLTQLGHVTRDRDGKQRERLGICRRQANWLLATSSWQRAFAYFDAAGQDAARLVPLVVKSNQISNVHRHVPLDLFIVPVIERGKVAALSVHAGIWTSAALNTPPDEVPRLRRQFTAITDNLGYDRASHTGKALLHALTVLPHDLLIGLDDDEVCRLATKMSGLTERPRPRLALIEAPLGRHLFAFVWLPRDLISTEVRKRITSWLEQHTGGSTLDWSLHVEQGDLALLRFVIDIREVDAPPAEAPLDLELRAMLRGWSEAVEAALAEREEPARAAALAGRYADAFPVAYRIAHGPAEAALDIERLRKLSAVEAREPGGQRDARFHSASSGEDLRLKIYQVPGHMPLSDAVPTLENFGFRVLAEIPTSMDEGRGGTIHDFTLGLGEDGEGAAQAVLARSDAIETALAEVLGGRAEDDLFNRLITAVGLDVQEVDWLRAFYRYLRQTSFGYTIATVVGALASEPDITRALIGLFRARLDPAHEDGEQAAKAAREAIREGLAGVAAINDDRLLRRLLALIEAVLRTNAFMAKPQEALALKIDSGLVPGLPLPVPWREIFVYSRRVEGIHLRAGPVARGGLRWSDRRDDFRAEILGLMKAQRVKNAVIVPTGAKGGFYPKLLPDPARDRDAWAAEGQDAYEIFIRTLLSITDNIVDGKVVHPDGVATPDGDDPYFVVAADKGTARFSDVANAIALERGFWLGDAFASGGSNGYDHKAMGITARGAWVSVQRHFREMGVDVQSEPVRVTGCGDMSGDVFGNGMLLSKAIKLVAAFDHRHIFIDPDPDSAASWKERKRLFDLPRSSWDDYDKALISKGGGVFPRSMKRIPLSAAMQKLLGVEAKELEPDALISAILRAEADLLWFGGIGTYVKAHGENNVEVEDPANDALRVDADTLHVKVIGEGANLGITQAGRIEFALRGGRINTDFIDNSAGVDCSDNEVNIKIALADAVRSGKLSEKKRNALLEAMTDEVAALVLEDNRLQALALSIAERGGAKASGAQVRLIQTLEDSGDLTRATAGLADEETFGRRAGAGQGLTRPELAVMLSSTKLVLQNAIEQSSLPDDPLLAQTLFEAFPETMRGPCERYIERHQLRREIIATKLANQMVNRLGMVHPFELAEEAGANLAQVTRAFVVAERLFDLEGLWRGLDTAKMEEGARLLLFERTARAVRGHMADLLRGGAGRTQPGETVAQLTPSLRTLTENTEALLRGEAERQSRELVEGLLASGAPRSEARAVAGLFELDGATGIARLAADSEMDPLEITRSFTDLGERLGLDWAQSTAAQMNPSDPWERLLIAGLARDLQQVRLDFLRRLSRRAKARSDMGAALDAWFDEHAVEVKSFTAMVGRARASAEATPAMLAQIASQARGLLGQ